MGKSVAVALLGVTLWGVSVGVDAASVGLGVSVKSNDSTLYVPIEISDRFRIEPLLRYASSKYQSSSLQMPGVTITGISEAEDWGIGAGFFGVSSLGESATAYYGARVAYISRKQEVHYASSAPTTSLPDTSESASDGFEVAPTLGIEYRFSTHFSIAGEAVLSYSRVDGDTEETRTQTSTNVVFRYLF